MWLTVLQGNVVDMHLPEEPTMVITNPPWGLRLEGTDSADDGRNQGIDDDRLKEV